MHATFSKTREGRKSKDLKVKESEVMMEKTQFKVNVPAREATYKEKVKAHNPSSSEWKLYHLMDMLMLVLIVIL